MASGAGNISTVPDITSSEIAYSINRQKENLDDNSPENEPRLQSSGMVEVSLHPKLTQNGSFKKLEIKPQFLAKTRNIHTLHKLISSVQLFGDFCLVDISAEGICFSINDGNVCKVRLNLNRKMFDIFEFNGVWGKSARFTDSQLYADDTDLSDEACTYFVEGGAQNSKRKRGTKNRVKKNGKISDPHKTNNEEQAVTVFDFEPTTLDDSVFRTDPGKILFDIIIKPNILYDVMKDMLDLTTERFVLYCSKNETELEELNQNRVSLKDNKNSKIIFISKSKSDTIGYSKLIIPQRKANIPEFKLLKPIVANDNLDGRENGYQFIDCYNMSLSSTYHFHYFAKLIRAIKLSRLIKIRKDMNGITSLLLLLGKNAIGSQQQPQPDILLGSSIEFTTLESVPIDELSSLNIDGETTTLLKKLGYNNHFIEQLIKDDQDIQTIRVGNDGKFVTLDDFFGNAAAEFENAEPHNVMNHISTNSRNQNVNNYSSNAFKNEEALKPKKSDILPEQNNNVLKLTEQLTMSLLGHGTPLKVGHSNNIQVEKSIAEDDERTDRRRGKRKTNSVEKRSKQQNSGKKGRKKRDKDENDGIETVGGAIEIPLFI
ncbi:hypothetical protein CAS74_000237 [Pichia kudriavzevii]|uniref:DNA damage checkpoint control protein RAD17 n=1 Tax=Pichia kudriavzevii TaxID=4909 RepID=A0A1Z8JTE7_PICKU|nr:hypothetical protein CAS74_000237 [Pichia kudriavzevii]